MTTLQTSVPVPAASVETPPLWSRLKHNRNLLALWFMLPAAAFLILFLAYPLGLGVWMSFTDERIGRGGGFIGLENYEWLWDDAIFWLSVFVSHAARLSELCSGPSGQRAHNLGRFRYPNVVGLGR